MHQETRLKNLYKALDELRNRLTVCLISCLSYIRTKNMILVFTWKNGIYFNASNLAYQVSHFKRAPNWIRSKKGRAAMAKVLDQKTNRSATTPFSFASDENEDPLYKKDKFLWLHETLMPYFCRWLADWVEESFQNAMLQKSGESGQVKINAEGHEREDTRSPQTESPHHKRMKIDTDAAILDKEAIELCDERPTDEEVGKMHKGLQEKPWFEESINLYYKNSATRRPSVSSTRNPSEIRSPTNHFAEAEWRHPSSIVPPSHAHTVPPPILKSNHRDSLQVVAKENAERVLLPPLLYTQTQSTSHRQITGSPEHRLESQIQPMDLNLNTSSSTLTTPAELIKTKERELEIAKELLRVEQERLQVLERKILFELWSKTEKDDRSARILNSVLFFYVSRTLQR